MKRPLVALIIMDGWGHREEKEGNAVALADTPFFDRLWSGYPRTLIHASEERVGLPAGQMGNSEVGHLNLGAGRVVYQDLVRISKSIRTGDFFRNPVLCAAVDAAREKGTALHLVGLLSDGGVHSLHTHLYALLRMAKERGAPRVFIHPIFDGRDTPPHSGIDHLRALLAKAAEIGAGEVATVVGRYYTMDRDNRWDRVERAYKAMVRGEGATSGDPVAAVAASYAAGKTDEFIEPVVIGRDGRPLGRIAPGDSVIFFNFRADRARQVTRALTQEGFDRFPRPERLSLTYACMTTYDETFGLPAAFPPQRLDDLLARVLADAGLSNLRIAETEKYAHVTYFFNGGEETVYPGESRVLIPSPSVPTYDLMPEMSAYEVGERAVAEIASGKHDLVILNFANGDMVGHTGILSAAIRAIEAVDRNLERVVEKVWEVGGVALVTADHGNAEQMIDPKTGGPHTAHTTNLVPLVFAGPGAAGTRLREDRALEDIAPTILNLMSVPVPASMTGSDVREG
ncbi:MAG: phosphoglycerate mutase, 2,3-bisphosphoglycerate-independent [Deltaproteobacteria bacterium]|nr:phosphoglycerate mutase, 2,3-bisphosphoglycerate-independent [Deltaproteobacteria bacterium]